MRKVNSAGLALLLGLVTVLSPLPARAQTSSAVAVATSARTSSAASPAARKAAENITAEKMKEMLYFISSDEMAGRNTPSPGLDQTAKYIADRLAKLKLKPAGDNHKSYFQTIALRSTEVDREKTSVVLGERTFRHGEDFLPSGRTGGEAEGPLVYVGHGWVFKPKGINAYEGLDVAGKIMVVSGNGTAPPSGVTLPEVRAASAGDWESPVSYARKHGAKGLILIPRNFDRAWRFGGAMAARPTYRVARFDDEAAGEGADEKPQPQPANLPTIIPSREMLTALFAGEQVEGSRVLQAATAGESLKGFDLAPAKRLRVALSLRVNQATTQNVVAVIEGKDSKLKNEYVALGAHYDHVGVGREINGDSIYNGADDDGSGTTALLAMAEAFSKGPRPKRSILFVWHAGEEKGLWGSQYFVEYPTVPLQSIVTQLNIDMIGRSKKAGDTNPRNKMLTGPDEIYVIGSKMMSTELGNLSESVNSSYLGLKFNYHYDQPNDPERLFYRSDHFNYARKGVPIIFYFDGVHEDYHQPSDHADKIDYEKMQKVTRTVFVLASELANAPARPVVDKQIPPERLER
ncbi:MAG TPA: M28 family peptidase [Pyrinomonadaceae bacterium]|nr:M28 family peptidase [Pyrinomonadaceae bacterium]